MDNIRQASLIVMLIAILSFNHQLGLFGVLGCLALVELAGTIFMFAVIARVFHGFSVRMLFPDVLKLTTATVAIMVIGIIVTNVPLPWEVSERLLSAIKLGILSLATLVTALPILLMTGSLTRLEVTSILQMQKASG
jgi:hypothetical protein